MNLKIRGLVNMGNTCYFNSVIQCLYHTEIFTLFCQNNNFNDEIFKSYKSLINAITKSNEGSIIMPKTFKNIINKYHKYFANNNQHDSHEFLINFIDYFNDNITKLDNIFYGDITSIICCEQNHQIVNKTKFSHISLPVINNSLDTCLKHYFTVENIEDYKCEKCNKKISIKKIFNIDRFPNILIFHFKRLLFLNKNNVGISFPIQITINNNTYNLYGIINHIGGMGGGHYTSIIKLDNKFYHISDEKYMEIKPTQINTNFIYMLFYKKIK